MERWLGIWTVCLLVCVQSVGSAQAPTIPAGQQTVGPIEDTSYAAGLPGALYNIVSAGNENAWSGFLNETSVLAGTQIRIGKEVGNGYRPAHSLALGYASFINGYDVSLLGSFGRTDSLGAEFRTVGFSPGRDRLVHALRNLENAARAMQTIPRPRGALDDQMNDAIRAVVEWSELPHLALRARWVSASDHTEYVSGGLAASLLRPLKTPADDRTGGIECGANLDYVHYRERGRCGVGLWDPSFSVAWRDRVFRPTNKAPLLSRWRVHIGAFAGVRNALHGATPYGFFVRVRVAPPDDKTFTPRQMANRTAIYSITARRDGDRTWLYGIQAAWLR